MIRVEEINRIEDLARFRAVWESLLAGTPGASFFHSLPWLEVYWEHFGAGQKLRALVVSSSGQPVGIMPLVVRSEPTKLGSVRVLTYPLSGWGSSYGPIGPQPDVTLSASLAHVRRVPRDWDIFELRWVDNIGVDHGQTERAMRAGGFRTYRTIWEYSAVVDVSGNWDDYLASHTSKWRNNLRRAERRLAAQGSVDYLRYRPRGRIHGEEDPRWDLYDLCETVARQSWQGSATSGTTLSHESIRRFLRHMHVVATKAGAVDLNLLLLDRKPLAFAYNYYYGSEVFGLREGYDANLSREGAGTVLNARMIDDSFRRDDRVFNLGPGYLDVKRRFFTRIVPTYRFSHFHPGTPRSLLLQLKRWLQERLQPQEASSTGAC